MTVLSAQSIRGRCLSFGLIKPHHYRRVAHGMTYGLSPAGYDVRIAQSVVLPPGRAALASTIERFKMPNDLQANVTDKSTWARRFLSVQNTVIEPGWEGYLTLELHNFGADTIRIRRGMPIAQIVFHLLDSPTSLPYRGKYQNQEAGPVEARMERSKGSS